MGNIHVKVYVTKKVRTPPISVVYGSTGVGIEMEIMDYDLPIGSTAEARATGKFAAEVYKNPCTVDGNIITMYPETGFFVPGGNEFQVVITAAGKTILSFVMDAVCDKDIGGGNDPATPEQVLPLVQRAENAATQAEAAAARAEEVKDSIPADYMELSDGVNQLNGDLSDVKKSVFDIGDYILGSKIAIGYKFRDDGEILSDENRKIVAFPVTDKPVYVKTKYGYQFRAGQSVATKLYTRIGEFSGFVSIRGGATYLAVDMDVDAEADYGCYDIVDVVSNLKSEVSNKVDNKYFTFERTPQLFDKHNPYTIDAYFDSSKIMRGGNFKSFYIQIDNSNTQITVNRGTAGNRFSVAFTSEKPEIGVSVSGYVNKNSSVSITADIPLDANYLIVWFYNSIYDTRTVEEMLAEMAVSYGSTAKLIPYTVLSFEYDKAHEALKEYIKSPLVGKKMNCLGDSFTDDSLSYEFVLKDRIRELTTVHVARGGSAIVSDFDSESLNAPSFLSRIDGTATKPDGGYYTGLSTDADITVIMGGINDCRDLGAGTITLGNIDSAHDATTFYGGMQLLLDRVIEMIPNQYILGVVPPSFNPSAPYTTYIGQVQAAEREIYLKYHIPFVDLAYDCFQMSDNPTIMELYRKSVSGTTNYHPNVNGHKAIAGMIQGKLESLIR